MQRLEVSGAVRYIYICVIRRLKVKIDLKELGLETLHRWALVALVKNFRDPENMGNFYTTELLASQELCSME
jgi:uncharacterized protein YfeS